MVLGKEVDEEESGRGGNKTCLMIGRKKFLKGPRSSSGSCSCAASNAAAVVLGKHNI